MGRGAALPDPTTMESASGKQEADAFFFFSPHQRGSIICWLRIKSLTHPQEKARRGKVSDECSSV